MTTNKFVRASLYRHVHGVLSKPENEFTHIKAQATGDGTFIAANEKLFAYAGALPGRVHIWPLDKPGRIGADAPYIHVHKAGVLDYEFNTLFHDELTGGGTASLLATGSDDCAVAVTAIPNTGLKSNITDATLSLQGHERRVNVVHWHPTASNLLATGSADQTIKVWDIGAQKEALSFDGFGDGVSAFDWHCHGAHLIATCKDTKVRVYDPRSTDSVQTFQGLNGAGISRMVWKGDSTQVIGVGSIKGGSRQMGIWDTKNPSKPIMLQDLDNAGGSLFPYYDPDNTILYISGKGDGQIRYWEVTEDEPYVHFISAFTDTKSHAGVSFLPKKSCDYAECEIAIALRMMGDKVTKVSFRVPRKQTGPTVFHKDLYPETSSGLKPAALSADEWLGGENRPIVKMPMNIASGAREMTSALATPTSRAASASVSGSVSPRTVSSTLTAPASTSGRSVPELERMLAQAKLKIMDLQAEVFELEQKAAKKTLDKDSAAAVKAASTAASTSTSTSTVDSAAATSTSSTSSNPTSPISSPRDSSASVTTRDAAASISTSTSTSTEALPGESEAQTAARIKKAKAKAAANALANAAREKEAAKAAEKNTSAELDKAKKEAEDKIRREQQAAQAERDAEKKAKEEKEKAEKRLKEEQQAAEKKAKEEKEKADKKAKEEKEKAEKKAKEDRDAAEKQKIKEEKEAAEKKLKAEKASAADKEAAALKVEKEEADLRKASAASVASADSDASHHMRFHADEDDGDDDDDAEAERLRAETVAKAEAIERAEAIAKKQKEIEAKAKATMEKKKAKDDTATDMKTSASAAVSAATSTAASPTNSAPSSEPSSPTGSKKGKKGKKDKDKKKGDCIIC